MFEYYEPFFALRLEAPLVDTSQVQWVRYNPRKEVARWGASLTSLDGKMTGVPDLDSIFEYNKQNKTQYTEKDFIVKTPLYDAHFKFMDPLFDLGRSHVIKLGAGGFFPYHRDFDTSCFRLIYTMSGCEPTNLVWVLNNEVIKLQDRSWYYVNTKMIHSVFSFAGCQFAVFNVIGNEKSKKSLIDKLSIK